jgi:hypothetical protein
MAIQNLLIWFTSFLSYFFDLEVVIYAVVSLFSISLFNLCLRWVRGGRIL